MIKETQYEMIKEFQCPGCGCGGSDSRECSSCTLEENTWMDGAPWFRCKKHCSGTILGGIGNIYLGLPKGFNKVGNILSMFVELDDSPNNIFLFESKPTYNHLNVPVWGLVQNGYLFLRVYFPE